MLTSRPVRVVIGAAVFALGILAGRVLLRGSCRLRSGAPALSRPDGGRCLTGSRFAEARRAGFAQRDLTVRNGNTAVAGSQMICR
jgi:hypothetical protein